MALRITWTSKADTQLAEAEDYLWEHWTEREIRSFYLSLEKALLEISRHPKRYKKSMRKRGSREYLLSRHTSIFYDFDDREVTILLFWQNKKNPKRLSEL